MARYERDATTDVYKYSFGYCTGHMLINILWYLLLANNDGGPIWGTGSIFTCGAKDCGIV